MSANPNSGVSALKKVRDANLMKEFMQDPAATLQKAGVDTSGMQVSKSNAAVGGALHSACVSVGCGACASVG